MTGTTNIEKIEDYEKNLSVGIDNEEITFLSKNGSSDFALASFSGYMSFTGQMAEKYGGAPGKLTSVVFSVSDGVITGTFDQNLNPQKDFDDVVGTALFSYGAAESGAFAGGMIAGPIGAILGGIGGGVTGGLFADDGWRLFKDSVESAQDNFSFYNGTIEGTMTPDEFLIKLHTEDPKYILKVFPEYTRYKQNNVSIESFSENDTLVSKLNYDKDLNKTTLFEQNKETNQLEPTLEQDLTTQDVIPLQENQNISGVAKILGKSEIDLAEYNNLTLENSKSLPTGTPIRSYVGNPEIISTPEGNIKLFENYDGSETAILPESITGEKTIINFDEDSSTLLYGDRTNPDKITYVDDVTNNYVEISKDSNGSYYKSLESNDDFTISYDNTKTITNIQITSDNVNLDEIANLTPYSKEDLQAFNFLDGDTVDSNTNFQLPASKEPDIQGGYGDITHFTTKDGHDIFVVPQEDGSSTSYGTFVDGFENQAVYERSSNGSYNITLSNEDGSSRTIKK
ncbi:hypothetical protein CRV08_04700 [Halarcobacter ebronensis]|uniref:LysM domain-containing protein n=1 Tax=Halarcobacter ebronensis TaxID=1462615 RepID=A0A4Q0YFJ4_9BACT|nr:hypothetical protein [Halarcobacter ebronensis]RXJ69312.1 hypothetical protein CRV08_04700 [Halarcobacter ebronensis]